LCKDFYIKSKLLLSKLMAAVPFFIQINTMASTQLRLERIIACWKAIDKDYNSLKTDIKTQKTLHAIQENLSVIYTKERGLWPREEGRKVKGLHQPIPPLSYF
jgi:hypothetical protein